GLLERQKSGWLIVQPHSLRVMLREDPWCDVVGAAEAIHHLPSGQGVSRALADYKAYVSLAEWETQLSGLNLEVVPVKRKVLDDYKVSRTVTELAQPLQTGVSVESTQVLGNRNYGSSPAIAPTQGLSASAGTRLRLSGRRATSRSVSPKPVDAIQVWRAAKEKAMQSPRAPLSPRRPPATRVAGAMMCTSTNVLPEGWSSPKVATTAAREQVTPRRQEFSGRRAQVKDKDRSSYPSGSQMKPAMRINSENRKKLTEVLGASERISAKAAHPSKAFNTVPMTNLRIA
ncbi:unnamed protein product, partial [Polarella glacialis]